MRQTILVLAVALTLLPRLPSFAEIPGTETLTPIADTYVDVQAINSTFGRMDYLQVSDHVSGFSIIALMFDISHIDEAPSEAKLRLYCFDVGSRHVVGAHWCVNNTWNEENLTFILLGKFSRTNHEDAVMVDSAETWYEWTVTGFINEALKEEHEKISLTLEVEDPLEGVAFFASKDQPWQEYSPQLVFTYLNSESETEPLDILTKVAIGLAVAVTIVFVIRFSRRQKRKRPRRTKHQ